MLKFKKQPTDYQQLNKIKIKTFKKTHFILNNLKSSMLLWYKYIKNQNYL